MKLMHVCMREFVLSEIQMVDMGQALITNRA